MHHLVTCALLRCPEGTAKERDELLQGLELLRTKLQRFERDGIQYGWTPRGNLDDIQGLTALTAATPIHHREALSPRVKSLNYLSHILAKVEGIAAGVDEVIMLDSTGYVAEASGMNLFAVSNGTLKTPPPYTGILRGVTRDTVIELGREAGYAIEELPMNRYDLYTADEVFLTGTAAEIVGVSKLDGRTIGTGVSGPVTRDLATRFRAYVSRDD